MSSIVVETERLIIREAEEKDSEFILQLVNDPGWILGIGDRNIRTKKEATTYIKSLQASYKAHGYGLYCMQLKESFKAKKDQKEDDLIGIFGYVFRDFTSIPDLGYALLSSATGKGFASEAGLALISFGFERLKLPKIVAYTSKDNSKSVALLGRLGLKKVGTQKFPNSDEDLIEYVLSN